MRVCLCVGILHCTETGYRSRTNDISDFHRDFFQRMAAILSLKRQVPRIIVGSWTQSAFWEDVNMSPSPETSYHHNSSQKRRVTIDIRRIFLVEDTGLSKNETNIL